MNARIKLAGFGTSKKFKNHCVNESNASNFKTRLFADDTALLLFHKNLIAQNNKVNSELLKVETCLNANKLTLNYAKTKYLFTKPNTNSFDY